MKDKKISKTTIQWIFSVLFIFIAISSIKKGICFIFFLLFGLLINPKFPQIYFKLFKKNIGSVTRVIACVVAFLLIGVTSPKSNKNDDTQTANLEDTSAVTTTTAEETTALEVTTITNEDITTTHSSVTTVKKETTSPKVTERVYIYNQLQEIYCSLDEGMSYDEILNLIKSYNLPYQEHEYTSGDNIKVAFSEKVVPDKYAEAGEYVKVSFNEQRELEVIEYHKVTTIFQYIQGNYYDFRTSKNNEYKGLYIKGKNGITIVYDNGNTVQTDYVKVDTKEEQLISIDALEYEEIEVNESTESKNISVETTESLTTTTIPVATTEKVTTTTIKETEPPKIEEPQQNDNQSRTVYITPTGKKYHYDSKCGNGTYNPISLDEAIARGYEPCKKCT